MRRVLLLGTALWLIWLGPWLALIVVEITRRAHRLVVGSTVGTGAVGPIHYPVERASRVHGRNRRDET